MMNNKMIWHEGMSLEPQHFQQQDRYIENLILKKTSFLKNYFWGFTKLTLDMGLLQMGQLGILEAEGIFPDGTFFHMPDTDPFPPALKITEGFNNTTLYLGLLLKPVYVATEDPAKVKKVGRYTVLTKKIINVMNDLNEESEVSVAAVSCRILTDQDDLLSYTVLPITEIAQVQPNYQISFHKTFVASYLDVHQALPLKQFIQEVQTLLNNRAEMLANRLKETYQGGAADFVDLMLLQLSNKYQAIFRDLSLTIPLHPKVLYDLLIEMMSEMATYTHSERRPLEVSPYSHQDLFTSFQQLIHESRQVLSHILDQNAVLIPLETKGHGLWIGILHDKSLLQSSTFVLSVSSDLSLETIRTTFMTQVKIAPPEKIQNFVSNGLPGITLQSITMAPRQIPYHANFAYFVLEQGNPLWKDLLNSSGIALHVGTAIPGLKIELWAIKDKHESLR